MPSKEKNEKKDRKKGTPMPMIIDGVDTSDMSRDQLEQFALRLKEEMEREREKRNFFEVELDKIRTFWKIARDKAQELTEKLRKKERDIEAIQHLNEVESREKIQQMNYIQYENSNKIMNARFQSMICVKMAQEENLLRKLELLKDKRELKRLLRDNEKDHKLQMLQSKMESIVELRESHIPYEPVMESLNELNLDKIIKWKDKIDLVHQMQTFEIEERKNKYVKWMLTKQTVLLNHMRNYYNHITLNNMSLISALKQEMETLQHEAEENERLLATATTTNTKLKGQLEVAQEEVLELHRKLQFYDRDRAQLSRMKSRNIYIRKELRGLILENETLLFRNDTLMLEREALKKQFNEAVLVLHQKTNLKNVLLERKITVLEKQREKQDLKIRDTLNKCKERLINCGIQTKYIYIPTRSTNILEKKDQIIYDLKYELCRVIKGHDSLLAAYEAILSHHDISKEEFGFEPLRFTSNWECIEGQASLA